MSLDTCHKGNTVDDPAPRPTFSSPHITLCVGEVSTGAHRASTADGARPRNSCQTQHGLQTLSSGKALPLQTALTMEQTICEAPGHSRGGPLEGFLHKIRTLTDPADTKPKSVCVPDGLGCNS